MKCCSVMVPMVPIFCPVISSQTFVDWRGNWIWRLHDDWHTVGMCSDCQIDHYHLSLHTNPPNSTTLRAVEPAWIRLLAVISHWVSTVCSTIPHKMVRQIQYIIPHYEDTADSFIREATPGAPRARFVNHKWMTSFIIEFQGAQIPMTTSIRARTLARVKSVSADHHRRAHRHSRHDPNVADIFFFRKSTQIWRVKNYASFLRVMLHSHRVRIPPPSARIAWRDTSRDGVTWCHVMVSWPRVVGGAGVMVSVLAASSSHCHISMWQHKPAIFVLTVYPALLLRCSYYGTLITTLLLRHSYYDALVTSLVLR